MGLSLVGVGSRCFIVGTSPLNSTSSGKRFTSAKKPSPIVGLAGPQSDNPDSEGTVDWDASWRKARENKKLSDSPSEMELTKVERTSQEFKIKDADVSGGRDNGPRFTKWGGNVRGGKYQLGEGADRILEFWGNGDAMLYAAMAVIILMFVLLPFRPGAPM